LRLNLIHHKIAHFYQVTLELDIKNQRSAPLGVTFPSQKHRIHGPDIQTFVPIIQPNHGAGCNVLGFFTLDCQVR
jgi:hypothetical protein